MARKAKKRLHPMPKLGFPDQCLYWLGMILTGGGSLAAMIAPFILRDQIAFADDRAVAAISGKGELHWFWLFLWLFIAFLIILAGPYQQRIPIFGRKDIKYGPPAYPRTYPLLMKNKPRHWVSPKAQAAKKQNRRILAVAAILTLAFSLAMFPRCLYGREVLYTDGTVAVYNAGNRETAHYKFSDISEVELGTYYHRHRRSFSGTWYYRMTLRFSDGTEHRFSSGAFRGDMTQTLEAMLDLKERYGSLITISGTENLSKVVYDLDLTADEKAMLYRLFGIA